MRTLREGELTVNLPAHDAPDVDISGAQSAILCAPEAVAVQIDPPRVVQGDVLIPETVGERLRADSGTVVAVGTSVVGLKPGDRVLLRPYHGLWVEPFSSTEPPIVNVDDGGVRATGRKVTIRVDEPAKWTDLALPDRWDRPAVSTGRVTSKGADTWPVVGSRVVFSNFHRRTAHFGVDHVSEDLIVVDDGQIFATLGPSPYRADLVRFYGAGTDWQKSILMVQREGEWLPLAPWVLIERNSSTSAGFLLPERIAARMRNRARVLSWGEGSPSSDISSPMGSVCEVLLDPNPKEAIGFEFGDTSKMWQLVQEASIWAVIGD
jgi:hypothetical protein